MPELPDVEGFRRTLESCGRGRRIEDVQVSDSGVLRGVSVQCLRDALEGRRLADPRRHGKWLIARTDGDPVLLLHFGMTGRLLCCPPDEPPHRHDRVRLDLGERRGLRYRDQRKLQGLRLATSTAEVEQVLARQGPDALVLDREALRAVLEARRATVKAVLLDQTAVAGLGNLLVDEILWRARIHPRREADLLTADESRALHTALHRVLDRSVPVGRVPDWPSWLTGHRNDVHPTCPRGHGPLRRSRIAGRGTISCPSCQPENPLEDGTAARLPPRARYAVR